MTDYIGSTPALTAALPWYREINRRQWGILAGVWSIWALDAFDFILITFVLGDIAQAFGTPLSQVSLLILATFGVRWAGGLMFGSLSDRIGRKVPLLIALGWFTLGSALTGLSWSFASILAFRLFLGFGMAPIFALGSTLIAESWPEKHRSIGIGLLDAGWGVGGIVASIAYALVYPHFGWRSIFFVGIVPGLVLLAVLAVMLPESDLWRAGRANRKPDTRWPALRLFAEHPRTVVTLGLLLIFGQFAAWPLQGLMPTFLKQLSYTTADISWLTTASSLGQIAGFAASGFVIEWIGRRWGLAALMLLGSVSVYLLVQSVSSLPVAVVFAFLSGFFIVGAGGCFATIIAESLPSNVRGSGMGFLYNVGVFGGGVAPYVVLSSLKAMGTDIGTGIALFTLLGVLLTVGIVLGFVRETKGKALDA